jgi:hypothetical protein
MSLSSKNLLRDRSSAQTRYSRKKAAQLQCARRSSDVAEVVNRPKKRPGSRRRSSMTMGATRRQAMLI